MIRKVRDLQMNVKQVSVETTRRIYPSCKRIYYSCERIYHSCERISGS